MKVICIFKNIQNFLKKELDDFNKFEKIFFPFLLIFIVFLSFFMNDNKIALISALCGISYTILNGKKKIYCYAFGLTGTLAYSYLSFKNGLLGNFLLYFLYYFPMEIFGIFSWKKHLEKNTANVKKTELNNKNRLLLLIISLIPFLFFRILNIEIVNFLDFMCLFLSIIAMFLAVKRCIEQWYYWTIVNIFSIIIWIEAYIKGSNCFATILMWAIYLILGIYFLFRWKKEKRNNFQI